MPYGISHYKSLYRDSNDTIYLEEAEGQFKIQRRPRFRLHPGISSNGGESRGTGQSRTSVLQFHGWQKGSPIIQSDDDEESQSQSVLSCLKMECSSSSRDSSSTPPFIENPSDENSNDSSVRDSYREEIPEAHLSEEDEGVELKNQELRSPKFAEEEDDALSSIINRSRQEDEHEDQSEDEPEIEPDDEPENEPENKPQPQNESLLQPPILSKSETEIPSTDSVYQRRKKAIYRRAESVSELEVRRARMQMAIKNRLEMLETMRKQPSNEKTENPLSRTILLYSGNRHGTFEGRPSTITSQPVMYPDEFGSIQVDQRQFIKPDYNDPNFNPITAPLYPPTKIQISVMDVVPSVWASEFVKPKQNSTIPRMALKRKNTGEISHAEVARRTEVALRRNEERKAEKEERKLRMAQARLLKENTPKTQNTPTAKRVKQTKKKETPKQSRTPLKTPSRSRGSKRINSTQKTVAKDQQETPKNQSRSARAKRVRGNPVSPIESNRKGSSLGSSGVEKALDYSAQVFAAVEEEIKAQIKTSPQRFQKMKSVLTPKLNQNPRNSYENKLFDNLTIESREDPNLWNSLVPYGPSASKSIRKLSRESRSKSSESHARTKFANSQLTNMLNSHILTQNHCEYALTTLEEPPEYIKLSRTSEISEPSPKTKLIKSGESLKSIKNKAPKNLRKSARNVEKQKKELEKKAEEEKTEKPERTKIEYSGINKFRFGSGSNSVLPTTPTKIKTKLQDTNETANMQNAPAKVQNNQLLLTPPKNLRKLSKDYSPNSIEKETKLSRTPDRAGSPSESVRGAIGIDVSPNVSLKEPKVVLERTGLRTRNKTVQL